ncbi:MAG: Fe-S cluster assembly ATPase SufC [Thermoplasmata archaeon]|uniref:Fe-S cluster assembly ATPase SufC n=1 Tax=Candidatus Sysuiplasma superficiale TaxID=2823368 RepID=A0A8J7YJV0_9ARCH|nr:Fe-S cluster assembly ATPase SufC [Candidatus Sysuiplasma superficiale]MBX8643354.1 Fe-S cluster assembly ATPase SufC [Candidatus Sysuiplasma superficiale]MCL4347217.1 Fe-S cluster assembly ATPase SufC [Candidatus Thermoplasmatota archaeon]
MTSELVIRDLKVSIEGKQILKGINLTVRQGEIHAIMGPNGSGKSTMSYALMGHPKYQITGGQVLLDGQDVLSLTADKRARAGLFLGFQYPVEVPGVRLGNFLRIAYNSSHPNSPLSPTKFFKLLKEKVNQLGIDENFIGRSLNEGFSGGEKKRAEVLQMAILQPKFGILDETDSGLDIDSLKIVATAINSMAGPNIGLILVTHYQRLLQYITPQFVHVVVDGRIVKSGGKELARELEEKGYDWLREPELTN